MSDFERELSELINKHSKENESDTPDFILAEYLNGCLTNFNEATNARRKWYTNDFPAEKYETDYKHERG